MEYTIDAKPITYKGRLFRSRLEGTWAAYFDIHDIKWQYEPRIWGLKGWLPDFALDAEFCDSRLLVEVKPIRDNNTKSGCFNKALGHGRTVLLLGASPQHVWLVPMDCQYKKLQHWLSCRGVEDGGADGYDNCYDKRALNWSLARRRMLINAKSYEED
jgi:hypothetical protein